MRVPLQDICAGPRCRFFTTLAEAKKDLHLSHDIPFIWYGYDKTEDRLVKVVCSEKVKQWWGAEKFRRTESPENVRYYHVVEELWSLSAGNMPYCAAFQSGITAPPQQRRWNLNQWLCDETSTNFPGWISSNLHSFTPIEEMAKFRVPEPVWYEGKCPSFVAYPIHIAVSEARQRLTDNTLVDALSTIVEEVFKDALVMAVGGSGNTPPGFYVPYYGDETPGTVLVMKRVLLEKIRELAEKEKSDAVSDVS